MFMVGAFLLFSTDIREGRGFAFSTGNPVDLRPYCKSRRTGFIRLHVMPIRPQHRLRQNQSPIWAKRRLAAEDIRVKNLWPRSHKRRRDKVVTNQLCVHNRRVTQLIAQIGLHVDVKFRQRLDLLMWLFLPTGVKSHALWTTLPIAAGIVSLFAKKLVFAFVTFA